MALPDTINLVTVTGPIVNPATGAGGTGSATFYIPFALRTNDGVLVGNLPPIVARVVAGAFTVTLPATDDTSVVPQDWLYLVTVNTDVYCGTFQFSLPSTPTTVAFAALVPVPSFTPPATYVPLNTVGQPGGPGGPLRGDGTMPPDQIPGGGGGVVSVTAADATIVVAGTATAPTVQVGTDVPQAAVAGLATALTGKATAADLTAEVARAEAAESARIPLATVTTKGDLVVASGAAAVTRLGVGSDGQVLTASSTAAAGVDWADAGGGGGFAPVRASTGLQLGVFGPAGGGLQPTTVAPSWTWVTLPAGKVAAGHLVQWSMALISTGGDSQCDLASLVDGAPVNYYSDGFGPTQGGNGHSGMYISGDFGHVHGPQVWWLVQDTDLASDGTFTLAFLYQGAHTWGSNSIPGQLDVVNFGPPG